MKRFFLGIFTLASLGSSQAEATCYQASKCVVPFIPSLNWTLGGDLDCISRINTTSRGATREVRREIILLEDRNEQLFGLDVEMIGANPIPEMVVNTINIPDSQCQ
jgi:hypothetical protein